MPQSAPQDGTPFEVMAHVAGDGEVVGAVMGAVGDAESFGPGPGPASVVQPAAIDPTKRVPRTAEVARRNAFWFRRFRLARVPALRVLLISAFPRC